MPTALALAFLLQSAAPAATPGATPAAASSVAGVEVAAPAPDPQKVADDLALVYDQSCGGRIYGTYAEACNGLAAQLREARAAARKAAVAKGKAR
jgi:hypothetical protein